MDLLDPEWRRTTNKLLIESHLLHLHQVGHERGSGAGPKVEYDRPRLIQKFRIEKMKFFGRPDVVDERVGGRVAEPGRLLSVSGQA